ncbi:FkbM family methyltransferase [Xanthomonas phaseoli pv. phaseoli]|uniref:FkbM family methyltransferase n=1 Tax=Xanthomonas phaseoli TaxID=1985254 RepID=UPI0009B97872|nr:FkbM family methyltransferase [Xanthomonas phaseoli]QWN28935.1 FkbM family methyltransferase [Xanthomonas phaseoli pv. phaseoli]UZB30654.1 FkbM family methyltransferase [Xanthomonas phaseoli pv. phaseoli]
MYPFLSKQQLIRDVFELRDALAQPHGVFPALLDRAPSDFLKKQNFIICGSVCRSEIRVLAKSANVIAIVDDFLRERQRHIFGIPVISSDTWVELAVGQADVTSCILTPGGTAFQHFTKTANQWNLPTLLPLQFLHLLEKCGVDHSGETGRFFWYGYEFFNATLNNVDYLVEFSNDLTDEYSQISWLCILLHRLTLNPFYLEACAVGHGADNFGLNSYSTNRQFFKFNDEEVYVDGGAFNGDTIEGFLRACKGDFKRIHSFEPSIHNNNLIRSRLNLLQDQYLKPLAPAITLHEKGLWDSNTTLKFNPGQIVPDFEIPGLFQTQSAHLVESNIIGHIYEKSREEDVAITVPVTTIDEATERTATFIKLEIEGSELKALHGARETIEKNRPKMAISAYHKPEDLLTLTKFVKEMEKDYQIGFRQHNRLCPDAMVLYYF